jgi:hypothetical protein
MVAMRLYNVKAKEEEEETDKISSESQSESEEVHLAELLGAPEVPKSFLNPCFWRYSR